MADGPRVAARQESPGAGIALDATRPPLQQRTRTHRNLDFDESLNGSMSRASTRTERSKRAAGGSWFIDESALIPSGQNLYKVNKMVSFSL